MLLVGTNVSSVASLSWMSTDTKSTHTYFLPLSEKCTLRSLPCNLAFMGRECAGGPIRVIRATNREGNSGSWHDEIHTSRGIGPAVSWQPLSCFGFEVDVTKAHTLSLHPVGRRCKQLLAQTGGGMRDTICFV